MKKVLVVMGSDSDLKVMEKCVDRLKSFDIPTEVRICSAHRTPAVAEQLANHRQVVFPDAADRDLLARERAQIVVCVHIVIPTF